MQLLLTIVAVLIGVPVGIMVLSLLLMIRDVLFAPKSTARSVTHWWMG